MRRDNYTEIQHLAEITLENTLTEISDAQVRRSILGVLYQAWKENKSSVGRKELLEILKIPEMQLDVNLFYLEEKGLVKKIPHYVPITLFWYASITCQGIDVFENPELYPKEHPSLFISIQGDNYGIISQAINSTVTFNQQVTEAFKHAYHIVESKKGLTTEQREEITNNLKTLEEEIKKKDRKKNKIEKLRDWLNENASWIMPITSQIIIEVLKPSA